MKKFIYVVLAVVFILAAFIVVGLVANIAEAFAEGLLAGRFDMVIFLTGVGARTLMSLMEEKHPRQAILEALGKLHGAQRPELQRQDRHGAAAAARVRRRSRAVPREGQGPLAAVLVADGDGGPWL